MRKGRFIFYLLFFAIGVVSCDGPGKDILPIDKMKVVFLHHIMVEGMLNSYQRQDTTINFDSAQNAAYRNILAFHKIDSATYYKSLAYYKKDAGRFGILVDSANNFGIREREKRYAEEQLKAVVDTDSTAVDSASSQIDSLDK